jgi:hypothetical protein
LIEIPWVRFEKFGLRNSTLVCLSIRYRKLPGRVNSFPDAIANNEMKIKVEEIDESKLMEGFQKIANRITMGLGIAAGARLWFVFHTLFKDETSEVICLTCRTRKA